jgi:hypothetical protein
MGELGAQSRIFVNHSGARSLYKPACQKGHRKKVEMNIGGYNVINLANLLIVIKTVRVPLQLNKNSVKVRLSLGSVAHNGGSTVV